MRASPPRRARLLLYRRGRRAHANNYLKDYYAWLGEEVAGMIAGSAAKDADTARQYLGAYEAAGCDELIIFPTSADAAQVDLLADAAL